MCTLYVRCTLSVLQKECRKVWGARYRSENTVLIYLWFSEWCCQQHRLSQSPIIKCLVNNELEDVEGCHATAPATTPQSA